MILTIFHIPPHSLDSDLRCSVVCSVFRLHWDWIGYIYSSSILINIVIVNGIIITILKVIAIIYHVSSCLAAHKSEIDPFPTVCCLLATVYYWQVNVSSFNLDGQYFILTYSQQEICLQFVCHCMAGVVPLNPVYVSMCYTQSRLQATTFTVWDVIVICVISSYTVSFHRTQCHFIVHSVILSYTALYLNPGNMMNAIQKVHTYITCALVPLMFSFILSATSLEPQVMAWSWATCLEFSWTGEQFTM